MHYNVALWESHRILFREESIRLNKIIRECLQRLEQNPTDPHCYASNFLIRDANMPLCPFDICKRNSAIDLSFSI